jgi:hypothetical protein
MNQMMKLLLLLIIIIIAVVVKRNMKLILQIPVLHGNQTHLKNMHSILGNSNSNNNMRMTISWALTMSWHRPPQQEHPIEIYEPWIGINNFAATTKRMPCLHPQLLLPHP